MEFNLSTAQIDPMNGISTESAGLQTGGSLDLCYIVNGHKSRL